MSLINEALKKAQRQRTLDAAPLSAAPSGVAAAAVTTHVRAATHRRSHAPLWFGLGILALGVSATVLVMRYGFVDTAPTVVQPAPASPLPLASVSPAQSFDTASPAPGRAASLPPPPAPVVAFQPVVAPVAPVAVPVPAPVSAAPVNVPAPSPSPISAPVAAPVPVVAVPRPTAAERQARVYDFLNTLRITGVRGLDREARVLMNERVWRLNDVVSPELGLRLSAVRPGLLVFTDAQGGTYEKPH